MTAWDVHSLAVTLPTLPASLCTAIRLVCEVQ